MAKSERIQVMFQPHTAKLIRELADATGQSMSCIVSSFMDESAAGLVEVIKALKLAKTRPLAALDLMSEQLAIASQSAAQGQLELVESRKKHHKRREKA